MAVWLKGEGESKHVMLCPALYPRRGLAATPERQP